LEETMLADHELIARADANYFESMSRLAAAMDGGEVRESGGVVCINSGTALAWFNIGFITRPLGDPEGAVRRAVEYYDAAQVPFILRVREGVDPAAERACDEMGLPYSDTVPGMALAELSGIPEPVRGLDIRVARDEGTLAHHREVAAVAFELPQDMAERYVPLRVTETPDVEFYVGYVDGEPAATSALFATHRVAGVYNVAVLPQFRRRGLAEAMTWHVVREGARMGCVMSSLQASAMGKPVYERMGFREIIGYRTFHRVGV
jgi:ribosomal protein S18 acetylase RimI-like enzyme